MNLLCKLIGHNWFLKMRREDVVEGLRHRHDDLLIMENCTRCGAINPISAEAADALAADLAGVAGKVQP